MGRVVLLVLVCVVLVPTGLLRAEEGESEELSETERRETLRRATELNRRGFALFKARRITEAIALTEECLTLLEHARGTDHPDVVTCLNNLAKMYTSEGRFAEARPLRERMLKIREKSLGPTHPRTLRSCEELAAVRQAQGAYEDARSLHERALRVRERVHGPGHPDVATSLNNVAEVLRTQGRLDEAEPLYERALALLEAAFGPHHADVAGVLNNMALLLAGKGRYDAARAGYERAIAIWERTAGGRSRNVAKALNNLALLLQDRGQYQEARPLLERALALQQATLSPVHPDVAASLFNLAGLLRAQGCIAEAGPLYERALTIWETKHGPSHPRVASGLDMMACILHEQGKHAAALRLVERARVIRGEVLGPDHRGVATSEGNMGLVLRALGRLKEARHHMERAVATCEKALGGEHPAVAGSLNNLAFLLEEMKELKEAERLHERALAIREAAYGPDHPDVALSLNNLAGCCEATGRSKRAGTLQQRALSIVERNVRRNFSGLHASERLALVSSLRHYLTGWLTVAPRLGLSGYAEVLRFKGLVARATAAERRLARQGGAEALARVADLRAAERRHSQLANSMPPMFRKERHKAWQEAYATSGAEREKLALELAQRFAPLREGLERLDLTLTDVQAQLDSDSVFIDVLRSANRYLAWIVRHEGEVERLELGDAATVEEAAARFAGLAADSDTRVVDEGWRKAGEALRGLVWTPIEERLPPGIRIVYLCPDAALAAVPFAALPGKDEGRCLIDDCVLVNLSMAQDLVPWKGETPTSSGAVAVGDVDYTSASAAAERLVEPVPAGIAAVDRAPRGRSFGALPETGAELAYVRRRLGDGCSVLLGADASEARFRAEAKGKRIIHLATHAFVRDDLMRGLRRRSGEQEWLGAANERQLAVGHDPMNLAGLAMAGANPRKGGHGDDGILTALEVSHLDLSGVELVVLSACQTALGKAESGEGVIGLVQGFQMAGAERVIASLWQVDDEATRLLMQHVYDGMLREKDPLSPAEALHGAMLRVRSSASDGGRSFAAPCYWASFVCFGR